MSTLKATNLQHASSSTANLTLESDGSVSGGLPTAGRNLLYNSAMQVAQRGTSAAGLSAPDGYYTADRWATFGDTGGTWTQSVESDAPTGSGLRKSLKMLCTTANASLSAGSRLNVIQRLEGQDCQRIAKGTASAQQVTLSFWVKSNVTGTYVVEVADGDNSRQVSASYTINASATWEKKAITLPADTTGVLDNDNALSLQFQFWLVAGSTFTGGSPLQTTWGTATNTRATGQTNLAAAVNNYWQVTGVQLEVGPVATAFEFEPYETTLRKCRRYYYLHVSGDNTYFANANAYSATVASAYIQFPVCMRTAPTIVSTSGTDYYVFERNGATDPFNSLTQSAATNENGTLFRNTSEISGTAGQAGAFFTNNAAASVAFKAEL